MQQELFTEIDDNPCVPATSLSISHESFMKLSRKIAKISNSLV